MFGKKRLIEFVFVVLLVLVLSAFRTVTARADDATPPPTATPEVTQPAGDGSGEGTQVAPTDAATPVPTEATVTQAADTSTPVDVNTATPVSTDETVTQAAEPSTPVDTSSATPAPTQASGDAGSTSTDATALLISQIPQGSQLVLLSDQQPAIPLGSAEAANIIATGDPIWCPTGVTPKANTGGCTDTFGLFNGGLLNHLRNKTTSGTIWIETSYSEGAAVTLDKNDLVNIGTTANYALTLQGGWNGIQGTKTISGSSTFGYPLTINWNADVTLNDITVTGVTSGTALTVTTPKNITVTRVKVNTNSGAAGAKLDNTALTHGTGNVTVTSSQFNDNTGGTGLYVLSNGTITLSKVTADGNGGYGADLENKNAPSAKSVILGSGPYEFNDNGQTGLNILSRGAIAVKDIDALGNTLGDGAYLDNTYATSALSITLTGSNVFSENASSSSDGLEAYSNGAISANNLVANANGAWGAVLDNTFATTAQGITLTGSSNQFNSNGFGLAIYSKGNITLKSITASYNSGDPGTGMPFPPSGAELDNCLFDTVTTHKCTATGNVTLTGTNTFDDNDRTGLAAWSGGTITISNLSADGNGHDIATPGGEGAFLSNAWSKTPKSINLTGTNSFSNNYNDGLDVESMGAIAVSNVAADTNEIGNGVYLANQWTGAVGTLTVSGLNTFDGNGSDGLDAYSRGAILLNNLDAEGNIGIGAQIDNSTASAPQAVTFNGTNVFNSNGMDGLDVTSMGRISLNNLQASLNAGTDGALLDNSTALAPQSVTLSGTMNTFSNNPGGNGLKIQTRGAVSIANLIASGNEGTGALINNQFTLANPQNVTVSGTNRLNDNGDTGLAVYTYGTIAVNNLTASNNGSNAGFYGWGAYLDNCGYTTGGCLPALAKIVSLTGTNTFNGNYQDGLWVTSMGPIKGNALNASGNRLDGAYLNNHWGTASSSVITLTGINTFSSNTADGLYFNSHNAVTVNSVAANKNDGIGVNGVTAGSITVLGGSMTSNGSFGWQFQATTTVTLKGVFAYGNNGGGPNTNLLGGTLVVVRTYP